MCCVVMSTTTPQQQQQQQLQQPNQQQPQNQAARHPLPGTNGQPVRASYQLQLQVQALLVAMTDEEKMALGHSVTDLIVDCEFAGTTCTSEYVNLKQQHLRHVSIPVYLTK